jgi:hypothetical protein
MQREVYISDVDRSANDLSTYTIPNHPSPGGPGHTVPIPYLLILTFGTDRYLCYTVGYT